MLGKLLCAFALLRELLFKRFDEELATNNTTRHKNRAGLLSVIFVLFVVFVATLCYRGISLLDVNLELRPKGLIRRCRQDIVECLHRTVMTIFAGHFSSRGAN